MASEKGHRARANEALDVLKSYFQTRNDVMMAFLFGSAARGMATRRSDVDVAIYLVNKYSIEDINHIAVELENLLGKDVDLIVLNQANASIAWAALRGIPILIRDRAFYLRYMLDVSREAEDFREWILDLWRLRHARRHSNPAG